MLVVLKSIQQIFQTNLMQNQNPPLWKLFQNDNLAHLSLTVVAFLDPQTIFSAIHFQSPQFQSPTHIFKSSQNSSFKHSILKLLSSYYFLKQFINKTPRSMYYSFYQEPQFIDRQNILASSLIVHSISNSHQKLSSFYQTFSAILSKINKQASFSPDQSQQLKRIFTDPSLPLPSIKRQNQGMFCNTSLQIYLVTLRFPHYVNTNQQAFFFEELKQRIIEEQEICFESFFEIQRNKKKPSYKQSYQNLHVVRYMPHEINLENLEFLLLENNTTHNLIVYLFCLVDVWIDVIVVYLESITDPYEKFLELMARYSIFRSLIIQVQESLGFLFQGYENLYCDTIRDHVFYGQVIKPKYCFWRPALTKWFQKVKFMHKQATEVYFIFLTQMRQSNLKLAIESLQENNTISNILKENLISLNNIFDIDGMASEMKTKIYSSKFGESSVVHLFEKDPTASETLVFEYIEYMIDLSINQHTVHWCGHSQQKLGKAFQIFLQQFLSYNQIFCLNLKTNLQKIIQNSQSPQLLYFFIQKDIEFLQEKNIKPVILKQLLKQVDKQNLLGNSSLLLQLNTQLNSVRNLGILKLSITENDKKLKYFNQKAKILQSIEGNQKHFFQIPSLLSLQEIISKSIKAQKRGQESKDCQEECYQYISDEQEQTNHQQKLQIICEIQDKTKAQNNNLSEQDRQQSLKISQNSTIESNQTENDNPINQNQNQRTFNPYPIYKTNSF